MKYLLKTYAIFMGAHNVNIYAQYANYITNTSIMGTSREVEGTIAC